MSLPRVGGNRLSHCCLREQGQAASSPVPSKGIEQVPPPSTLGYASSLGSMPGTMRSLA